MDLNFQKPRIHIDLTGDDESAMDVDAKVEVKVDSKESVGLPSNVEVAMEPLSKADVNAVSLLNPLIFPAVLSSPAPSDSDSSKPDQKVIILLCLYFRTFSEFISLLPKSPSLYLS